MGKELMECLSIVSKVVTDKGVEVYYQPIVSLDSKAIVGFEAFSRGVDELGTTVADAACLFNSSLPFQAQYKVETLCLSKSLDSYQAIYSKYQEMLLFLNVNAGLYCLEEYKKSNPVHLVEPLGYDPRIVVFEFDSAHLKKKIPLGVIKDIQKKGYRISVDNADGSLGCKERMFRIRPDFAKLDRKLYAGLDRSAHIKRMVMAAGNTFRESGALPVAKGVETESEAFALAEAGFYLQQGFFYSDSSENDSGTEGFTDKVARIHNHYRNLGVARLKGVQDNLRNFHLLLKATITKLQQEDSSGMDRTLEELANKTPELVSAFVLNAAGKQISKKIVGRSGDRMGMRIESSTVGSDHSHEDYFMYLNSGLEKSGGIREANPFCREKTRYLAGFFYKSEARRGSILVLEYVDRIYRAED